MYDQDNAGALLRQLIISPAIQEATVPDLTDVHTQSVESLPTTRDNTTDLCLPSDADVYNDAETGTKYDEEENIQYWYNMKFNMPSHINIGDPSPAEFGRVILETQHWRCTKLLCELKVREPYLIR